MSHFRRANVCLLRFFAAMFAFVLLVCMAVSLTACAEDEKTDGGNSGALRPPRYREGYTTEHKGEFTTADGTVQYDFTGTVHWIKNEDTGFEIYGRIFKRPTLTRPKNIRSR